jgi:hypothetical protein
MDQRDSAEKIEPAEPIDKIDPLDPMLSSELAGRGELSVFPIPGFSHPGR